MSFLTDSDIKQLLSSDSPPVRGINLLTDIDDITSQIQPCSLDLRISEIFLPLQDDEDDDVDSAIRKERHKLSVGQSVKVTTIEEFNLNNRIFAILFAPARLTRRGIIVPDIGHVDPGFEGRLRITLINLGKDSYDLKSGDTIVTVLLFYLEKSVNKGLCDRSGEQPYSKGLEDLRYLSRDFLNINNRVNKLLSDTNKRIESLARDINQDVEKLAGDTAYKVLGESGWRRAFFTLFLPILIGIVVGFGTGYATYFFQTEARVSALEAQSVVFSESRQLENRINELEQQISDFVNMINDGSQSDAINQ